MKLLAVNIAVAMAFRALTTKPELLVQLADVADLLPEDARLKVRRRLSRRLASV